MKTTKSIDICGFGRAVAKSFQHAIRKLATQRIDHDFLLLYFAGHGYPMLDDAEQRNVYLVTHDFDPAVIEELGDEDAHLSLSWLSKILYSGTRARIGRAASAY